MIELIKSSPTPAEAKERLIATAWESSAVEAMVERAGADACRPEDLDPQYGLRDGKYYLSPEQAQAILELRLHRLTGLEHEKLLSEYQEILNLIGELIRILTNPARLMEVIREELEAVKAEFGDARRTEIVASQVDLTIADLITEEDRVVTISHGGYAKSQPLAAYQAQRRGGKGKSATGMKDEDYIEHLLVANSHATLLLFSSKGKVYWLRTFEIPEASRTARGRPLVNLLPLDEGERITAMLQIDLEALQQNGGADDDLDEAEGAVLEGEVVEAAEVEEVEGETAELVAEPTGAYIFMATAFGTVKKTPLVQFSRPRSSGLIAPAGRGRHPDRRRDHRWRQGSHAVLQRRQGDPLRRERGAHHGPQRPRRTWHAPGQGQQLISMLIPESGAQILTASERGFGKRTPLSKFPRRGRGGQGDRHGHQRAQRRADRRGTGPGRRGDHADFRPGHPGADACRRSLLSGRNTQGVTLIKLASDEVLVGLERVQEPSGGDDEDLPEGEEAAESLGESAESEPAAEAEGNEE